MTKSDRQDIALLAGIAVLMIGVVILCGAVTNIWTLETMLSRTLTIVVGGFVTVIGAIVIGSALDVLDDLTDSLENIWESFLGAMGR